MVQDGPSLQGSCISGAKGNLNLQRIRASERRTAILVTHSIEKSAPDYADAMFNLALLLQRASQHKEAADCWRQYLANDAQSEWAARARRCLKFCEMQIHLSAC